MIKLVNLLVEAQQTPKMIVMAGAAGAGKSHVVKAIAPEIKNFEIINPDKYVEDPNSPMYNNLSAAATQVDDKDVPAAMDLQKNFLWDTTASNPNKMTGGIIGKKKEVEGILNYKGYDKMMIVVYAHPIVSFMRNFNRTRKVPKIAAIGTWLGVYTALEKYKNALGDNFMLYVNEGPEYQEEINAFEEAFRNGELKEFFEKLVAADPEKFASTFRKEQPKDLSPEELAKKQAASEKNKQMYEDKIEQLAKVFNQVQQVVEGLNPSTLEEIKAQTHRFVNS